MHNSKNFGAYGDIGYAVPYIEMYMPISSNLTLAMIDSKRTIDNKNDLSKVVVSSDETMFLNSLQVEWSNRFVACKTNNFALVNNMICKNPEIKNGSLCKITIY